MRRIEQVRVKVPTCDHEARVRRHMVMHDPKSPIAR
jgi:hypothetical protein